MDRVNLSWWCWVGSGINDVLSVKAGDAFASAYALPTRAAPFIVGNHSQVALVRLRISEEAAVRLLLTRRP